MFFCFSDRNITEVYQEILWREPKKIWKYFQNNKQEPL